MEYLFESKSGEQITIDYDIGSAPGLFATVMVGGKQYTRVPSLGSVAVSPNLRIKSHQLPRWYKFAKRFDSTGRPLIEGAKEKNEVIARARHAGEQIDWD